MVRFARNKRIISNEINYLKEVFSIITVYHDMIIEGINADEDDIAICEMPEIPIVLGAETAFVDGEGFMNEFLAFCAKPRSPKLNLSFPVGGYFADIDAFYNHPSKPTRFFSLDPSGRERKEKGRYLVAYTRGYYGETNDLAARIAAYAKKNKVSFDGPVYNIYLFNEVTTIDPGQYLMQISAAIKDADHPFSLHPHRHFQSNK